MTEPDALSVPNTPALDAWHEAHPPRPGADRPRTLLWFPHEAPGCRLDTINRGSFHDPVEVLPDPERVTCHVHLGSTIDVGGYLSDMEAYFAAVLDVLRYARWEADEITRRMIEAEPDHGS